MSKHERPKIDDDPIGELLDVIGYEELSGEDRLNN